MNALLSDPLFMSTYHMAHLATYAEHVSGGAWKPTKHLVTVADKLQWAVMNGKNVALAWPPRHGKSTLVAKWLPTWYLDLFPERSAICTSFEADLARQHSRFVRDQFLHNPLTNTRIKADAGSRKREAANDWETSQGGAFRSAGVGGSIIGRGGHLLVVDDPYANWHDAHSDTYNRELHDWWRGTFWQRREPGASVIVDHTRWGPNDLIGWLLSTQPDNWIYIEIPAIAKEADYLGRKQGEPLWPEKYDLKALNEIRDPETGVGELIFRCMYQQDPTAQIVGSMFRQEWIEDNRVKEVPEATSLTWGCIAIDPATTSGPKSDETGIAAVFRGDDNDYYVLDCMGLRTSPAGWAHEAVRLYDEYEANEVVPETNQGGEMVTSLLQTVRKNIPIYKDPKTRRLGIHAKRGKSLRAEPVANMYEKGRVHHVGTLPDVESQLTTYMAGLDNRGNGHHYDQMDALVYGVLACMEKKVRNLACY